uniref:Similarity n=1 Tax=Microcystis aeruginosa (strain PCC 7806) TaxID=267872 RepID=A8YBG3_MICA7|nr:unnamed protein product [Microcystis aeruginosa PCC 7806]
MPGEVDEFKANLSKRLKALLDRESEKVKRYEKVSFWCEDKSRFGCHTIARNKITGSSRFCVISLTHIGSIDLCVLCVFVVSSTPSLGGMYLRIHFTHQTWESQ